MVLKHIWGLFANPEQEWQAIRDDHCTIGKCYAFHVLFLAAIPAISAYIGTVFVGWQIGTGNTMYLVPSNAATMSLLFYGAMLVGVFSLGWMIHWMSATYDAAQPLSQSVVLAAYTATPLFLIGIFMLYPILWLNLILGLPAVAYTVYLLYTGVPIMMNVSKERGFLFSAAVLGIGLVALVALLISTVLLWGFGFGPAFTS